MTSSSHDATAVSGGSFNATAQAERAATTTSRRAGVVVRTVDDVEGLRAVSELLTSVWGRTPEGVPMPSDVLIGLTHAGGCTTAAFDASGGLVGASVLALAAPHGTTYSLIAAVAPGGTDRGVGHAVKLHQRVWALRHGHRRMIWTFDPLVSRNARFNLTKLGAVADEYAAGFYGRMADEINGGDEADRLVATWQLDSRRAIAASEGTATHPVGPTDGASSLSDGPDGEAMLVQDPSGLWLRVPTDIVELRRRDAPRAGLWRSAVRDGFGDALGQGLAATHLSRNGWYLLTTKDER